MNILALIPARGGSKGIPKKNIKKLNGKPLIEYSLDFASKIFEKENICVSTDDNEIIECITNYGYEAPFIRPDHLASDTANTQDVILHALNYYEEKGKKYDFVLLLQPTTPYRNIDDYNLAVSLISSDIDMVVAVKETKANPYYLLFEENEKGFLEKSKKGEFTRRQDAPKVYEYTGSLYLINAQSLKQKRMHEFEKIKKVVVSEINSIDIDTPLDWEWAEFLYNNISK